MRLDSLAKACTLALMTLAPSATLASDWAIDPAASFIGFAYLENDERRAGRFGIINPQLTLDPDNLSQTRGALRVSTASLDLGDTLREDILATRPWLDAGNYPDAIFVVERVVPGAQRDSATAIGRLKIKEISKPLSVPLKITRKGAEVTATGELRFDRLDYGLRDVVVENFVRIGDEITLDFALVARQR